MASTWKADYLSLTGELVRARKAVRLSQAALAARLAVHENTMRAYEAGTRVPDGMFLFRWSHELGVRIQHERVGSAEAAHG